MISFRNTIAKPNSVIFIRKQVITYRGQDKGITDFNNLIFITSLGFNLTGNDGTNEITAFTMRMI
ncbi:hypothetical protein FD28_GL002078 [Levilactobacillus hammesii DSM 16381]|uniref:Uncharacterized protein n=1 Tax=Levilactobacillus hammesii DSM 16381 TaxID=1423753 RepID=A0A0R1URM4_9LACO|nr:hypothetical protein FD28_GL002078 [Levilactobacillus hammesii DSM 16381]